MKFHRFAVLATALGTAGCAINPQTGQPEIAPSVATQFNSTFNSTDPCSNNDRNIGMVVGAVAGGVIGYLSHGAKGAAIGAVAGAGGGLLIGHLMDSRRCSLYKIAQANQLKLASAAITPGQLGIPGNAANSAIGLDVQLQNKSDEFEAGSSRLTPAARAYFTQIAQLYTPQAIAASLPASAAPQERAQAVSHRVLIVGHTDAQDAALGADRARLSQERAKAVAEVFEQSGVPASSIYYQGAGDALPIATNSTIQGREANDRVQIVDVPTQRDLQLYLQRRAANPANFETDKTSTPFGQFASRLPGAGGGEPFAPQNPVAPQATPRRERAQSSAATGSVNSRRVSGTSSNGSSALRAAATVRESGKKLTMAGAGYDFGGSPMHSPGEPINLGTAVDHSMFDLITAAHADAPLIVGSCLTDHPHPTTSVRNLQTAQALPPRDFVPGFYGTVWDTNAHGNFVAITGATIPLDGGAPIPRPTVLIYKNYRGNVHQAPSYRGHADVSVYRGTERTVYRLFIHGPARCLDLVVPNSQFTGRGNLYYDNGNSYLATPEFAMQR